MSNLHGQRRIQPVPPPPVQFESPQLPFLVEVDQFVRAGLARQLFDVHGAGLCAAVLDTGINANHVDFANRIVAMQDFTAQPDGMHASDMHGHGTNVAGIVLANGDHVGMAPQATLAALKVLDNQGGGDFAWVALALDWVIAQHTTHQIEVVCMSLGDGGNYTDDRLFASDALVARIAALTSARVAVVVAAGNDYYTHNSQQGMSYPAILRQTISVGAVYDRAGGGYKYHSGAEAFASRAGQITPFSQRLHSKVNRSSCTDIFAPGAPVRSAGTNGPHGESIQHGTSQAAPVTAGIIMLLQEFYQRYAGERPSIPQLVGWLRRGGVRIVDGDDEHDNVQHTGLTFLRVDAVRALRATYHDLRRMGVQLPALPAQA